MLNFAGARLKHRAFALAISPHPFLDEAPVTDIVPIRCAILSVSDKLGITDLAMGLQAAGVELFSTGGQTSPGRVGRSRA